MKIKIAALIVDRANYGRLRPVLLELKNNPDIQLEIIVSGSMLLDRFGKVEREVIKDGFEISSRIYVELEGSNPITMAKSTGLAVLEFSNELARLKPDFLLAIGDRYEALGAVIAAAYLNICIIHLQGGEVSGSIDECARHAITKFSHYHFPATERSRDFLIRMGENPDHVFNLGCPVVDVIAGIDSIIPEKVFDQGVGRKFSPDEKFLLVMFHPVTTSYGTAMEENVEELLLALDELKIPTVWIWPNIDAGADNISRRLRQYREKNEDTWLHLFKNFSPDTFQKVLKKAVCAIGNSSSFVRDSTFHGTPVVLIGGRQLGRETGENTTKVKCKKNEILQAIKKQMLHGEYKPSTMYGVPGAAKNIATKIAQLKPYNNKYLYYVSEEQNEYFNS